MIQTIKNLTAIQEPLVQSLGREDLWEKGMAILQEFLPEEFHGQKSLVDFSPWGRKESDTTEQLTLLTSINKIRGTHPSWEHTSFCLSRGGYGEDRSCMGDGKSMGRKPGFGERGD